MVFHGLFRTAIFCSVIVYTCPKIWKIKEIPILVELVDKNTTSVIAVVHNPDASLEEKLLKWEELLQAEMTLMKVVRRRLKKLIFLKRREPIEVSSGTYARVLEEVEAAILAGHKVKHAKMQAVKIKLAKTKAAILELRSLRRMLNILEIIYSRYLQNINADLKAID
uniref:Uncharacterized protein n=1 Tax=Clastoptera arizonana TaxID=38151 RepID=A0A1B6C3B7_9HEMI